MYYRRKVLLGLLQNLDRTVTRTELQKFLFLVSVNQEIPAYEFVPYRYGCFSFQAEADKRTLTKYGLISDQDGWALKRKRRFRHLLSPRDQQVISRVVDDTGHLEGNELIHYVYRHYPYYAINSETRCEILSQREQAMVEAARPTATPARLFTIGYEGRSLERYLNRLIENNVGALCDLRRNPISMKFGFSKRQLKHAVEGLGMAYVHMPELGIDSHKRRDLNSRSDYQALFKEYARTTLVNNAEGLTRITELIRDYHRVALTCFEASHESCHRGCVVQALKQRSNFRHRVAHL